MLLSFTVGNFKSYKDLRTLNLIASSDDTFSNNNIANLDLKLGARNRTYRILKSAVIYGANASGKSNFLNALKFVKYFIENSSKNMQMNEDIPVDRFAFNDNDANSPAFFELQFIQNQIPYRYGFELTQKEILAEWLFYSPKGKETPLFTREKQSINLGANFSEGKDLESKTRTNALFLSVNAQFNGYISSDILNWIKNCNIISGIDDNSIIQFTIDRLNDKKYHDEIINFIKIADLGISDITYKKENIDLKKLPIQIQNFIKSQIESNDNNLKSEVTAIYNDYKFIHQGVNNSAIEFQINRESQGTQKLFALAGPLIDTLQCGKILLVDELDTRLHPIISQFLISIFNSKEKNPNNAQLVFATHDTNLLSNRFFRRDQIWFTEKNKDNETDLYCMNDFNVRKEAIFNKDYIQGKYGAIPYIHENYFVIKDKNCD